MDYLLNEPSDSFGSSSWTERKLEAFEKYVGAYLDIMHSQRPKYNGWPQKIIYFDGFAGSGVNKYDDSNGKINENQMYLLDIKKEEEDVYKGSAERVVRFNKKFDQYFFVDLDSNAIKTLEGKLEPYKRHDTKFIFLNKDVNSAVDDLLVNLSPDSVALALFDPFGMQLNWSSIEKLKGKRIDVWILVPSGVIINRLLDNDGRLTHMEKLKMHYGLEEEKLKEFFYCTTSQQLLFENQSEIKKVNSAIEKCADLYIRQLKTIWKHVTPKPLVLFNTRNVPIYHFVFASNNKTALTIAKDIIGNI